jgi:hypothetical protein
MFLYCHGERLMGACLHAEVPAFAETLCAGSRYGTQAWQSDQRSLRGHSPWQSVTKCHSEPIRFAQGKLREESH